MKGVLFPVHMLGMRSLAWIGEWEPTDFSRLQPLELMILAGLALSLSGKLRLPPIRLVLLLGLIHCALAHGRNEQLLGIVGVLILAEPLGSSLARGGSKPFERGARTAVVAAWILAAAALIARTAVPLGPERTGADFAGIIDRVPAPLRALPVLNDYSLGGKLIFNGIRPFIDSRADLYGDAFLTQYRHITWPERDAVESALMDYEIAWTIFPSGHRIVAMLDREPGWRRFIETRGIVIHVRDTPYPR
jgi:hypothetical protein